MKSGGRHSPAECVITHPRIDLGRGNLPMPERPLDEVEIPGFLVQPGGEGVTEGMDREWSGDSGLLDPPGEVQLDLPAAKPLARLGPNQGHVGACVALCGGFTLAPSVAEGDVGGQNMTHSPGLRNTRGCAPPLARMCRVPVWRPASPTFSPTSDPSRMPVPSRISKISRSREAKGLVGLATTALSLLISASVRVDGSLAAAGDDLISRAGLSLIQPDSTQKAKNDRRADLVRLMVMGFRGCPSGVQSTASLIKNRVRSSGLIAESAASRPNHRANAPRSRA